jgi:putative ABC transport system permease protein
MLSPRWRKVLRDLWSNKTRTLLVVLSIAVGVFAIGMVSGSRVILIRDLTASWMSANPSSATLTAEAFDDELVQVARRMPGVGAAEARRTIGARVKVGPDEWKTIRLFAIPDFDDMHIDKVRRLSGAWPPKAHAVLLERTTSSNFGVSAGESLLIELPDGEQYTLRVDGLVHDPSQCPPAVCGSGFGYITLDTVEWLGQPRDFNQLNIVVAENQLDKDHITAIASQVRAKIEKSGRIVFDTEVPIPGKHPMDRFVQALILLLGIIGFFALLLSGFLVVNTIGALLTQQTRQIGVMKSIGARGRDIAGMYLVLVLAFGLLSLFVAVPLGVLGAWALSTFFAGLFNFDISTAAAPPAVLALQVAAGLLAPLLAALAPVSIGARITVREALGGYGLDKGGLGTGWIDKLLILDFRFWILDWRSANLKSKIQNPKSGMSRPLLLSLRNTFRRKVRLALTLGTLTIAGVMFMAVVSERASLKLTIDEIYAYFGHDVTVTMNRSYRTAVLDAALHAPGVIGVEYWSSYTARRLLADNREGTSSFNIFSLPAESKGFTPKLEAGRWLLPTDVSAAVVNTEFLKKEPGVRLGDEIRVKVAGKKTTLRVVGVIDILLDPPSAYVNQPYFNRVTGDVGKASQALLLAGRHDGAFQAQVAGAVEKRLKHQGIEVAGARTITKQRADENLLVNIIVVFLLLMSLLLAVVGGLGLMGTMSLNIIERTREIGVMRAIGATSGTVLRIVTAEGVLIGVLSWCIGVLLAWPASKLMNDAVGVAFGAPGLSFSFSTIGMLLWLCIVVVLAAVASLLPAYSASRVTVRDVLAYE